MIVRRIVAVRPAAAFERQARLFEALERAFPVRFVGEHEPDRVYDAAIVADAAASPAGVPTLVFARSGDARENVTLQELTRQVGVLEGKVAEIQVKMQGLAGQAGK